MKKVILFILVIAVSLIGFTSYNGKKENTSEDKLIAEIKKTGDTDVITRTAGGTKKVD